MMRWRYGMRWNLNALEDADEKEGLLDLVLRVRT